jgi:hypothetical protein
MQVLKPHGKRSMSTVDRLRADIDAGRTGDKIPSSDSAAAPLGTDEEAAGTPVSSAAVAMARRAEINTGPKSKEDGGLTFYLIAIVIISMVLAGGVLLFMR